MTNKLLDELRHEIDSCDTALVKLLGCRFATAASIGTLKTTKGIKICQPEREKAVLAKIADMATGDPYSREIEELYQNIFRLSRRIQYAKAIPYNIVLIGFMGCGKSTVGRYLANITGFDYYDSDKIIEERTGFSIPDIFAGPGEKYFRDQERAVVKSLSNTKNSIVACGGGTVLDSTSVRQLRLGGKLVWLQALPTTIDARINRQYNRPLLKNKGINGIAKLLNERQAFYEAAADYKVATDGREIEEIGNEILQMDGLVK
jgi:shikimate kinase